RTSGFGGRAGNVLVGVWNRLAHAEQPCQIVAEENHEADRVRCRKERAEPWKHTRSQWGYRMNHRSLVLLKSGRVLAAAIVIALLTAVPVPLAAQADTAAKPGAATSKIPR